MCLPVRVITAAGDRSDSPPTLSISFCITTTSATVSLLPPLLLFLTCLLHPSSFVLFYCCSLVTVAAAHKYPCAVTVRLLTSASFNLLNIQHFLLSIIISRLKEHQIIIIKNIFHNSYFFQIDVMAELLI